MRNKTNTRSFVEEELAREKKMRDLPESKFQQILRRFEKIFRSKADSYSSLGKRIAVEMAAQKYGLEHPPLVNNLSSQVWSRLLSESAITTEECLELIETRLIRDANGRFIMED